MTSFRIIEVSAETAQLVPQLIARIYGERFHEPSLCDPAVIAAAAGSGRQILYLALDDGDAARGLMAACFTLPTPAVAEVGMAMIDPALPAITRGRVLRALMETLIATMRPRVRERGLRCLISSEVASHQLTQRLVALKGFVPTGIYLGISQPRVKTSRAQTTGHGGETVSVRAFASRIPPYAIALPSRFDALLRQLYQQLGIAAIVAESAAPYGASEITQTALGRGGARVELLRVGTDAERELAKHIAPLLERHDPLHVFLPLTRTNIDPIVEKLLAAGFRYGALLPQYRGHDVLVLQRFDAMAADVSEANLHTSLARQIFRTVLAVAS